MRRARMTWVIAAAALWAIPAAAAAPSTTCTEDAVQQAVDLLSRCGVEVATYVAPRSCVGVVTDRFAFKDTKTLAKICTPETSGRCLDALLARFAPSPKDVESGLTRLAKACRDVDPFCAVDFIAAHQTFDPDQIPEVCGLKRDRGQRR